MYLGIDGGGTKTAFIIIDKAGKVLAQHEETTSYYIEIGLDGLKTLLINGVIKTLIKAKLSADQIDYAFFGLPAYGEDSQVIDQITAIPSELFSISKYICGNDMIPGWASALGCKNGINIVAGTGSIAYGEFNGTQARCGGWGEVFSDEGSAYWVAKLGLEAFTRMSDGRLEQGPLYTLIKSHFNLTNDLDICGVVLNQWQASRSKIAQLSVIVADAALAGDTTALAIFDKAAQELTLIIESTRKQLGYKEDEEVIVSYSGGVFNAKDLILKPLNKYLSEAIGCFTLVKPKYQPVIGSALYAAKLNGHQFSSDDLTALEN
ncbi:N-acetylglucosamine kinase [Pseudocolwellia sp. HL-MZ19]|uniref:N-acetylglucosamine kinase n=1 Tax=Pseudocolwellia sp. HL-MZ19 TaxID=3400846 RepID=UPI003CF71298